MITTQESEMPGRDDNAILDENAIKVMKALEEHPVLDHLQIAAFAEISITDALKGLGQLRQNKLLTDNDPNASPDSLYSLDSRALAEWRSARAREAQLV